MTQGGPSGIDESWDTADPATVARMGVQVVSLYLSRDPSKNATPARVLAYHDAGVGVLLNWEAEQGAPLKGAGQGKADGADAVSQADALITGVGYTPRSRLAIAFSCDTDTTPAQYPRIDGYYRAAAAELATGGARPYLCGAYGEADLIDHLARTGYVSMLWQTYAWSGGRLSPEAAFYQYDNGQKIGGASVDFDRIIRRAQLGAWWPPGHPLDHHHPKGPAMRQHIARRAVLAGLRAALRGSDHGYFSSRRHPRLIGRAGSGVLDRLEVLEAERRGRVAAGGGAPKGQGQ